MSAVSALVGKSRRHWANADRVIREQPLFKLVFIILFALAMEAGLFFLFAEGFQFLQILGGASAIVMTRLFALFFLGMGLMLAVSGVVTSYSCVFRSDEIPFLIVRPFTPSQIVLYKFIESTGLSSWAFCFIVIPFVGAYAWFQRMTPLFAVWTLLFSIPFLGLCSGLGTLAALVCVRWMPRGRHLKVAGGVAGVGLLLLLAWLIRGGYTYAASPTFNLSRLVPGLSLASNRLLPSWWVSQGIMCLSRGEWARGGLLWGMLATTGLAVGVAVEWLGGAVFYEGWQRSSAGGVRRSRRDVLFGPLDRRLSWLPHDVKGMVLKDLRTFVRDPLQWSQALIFFGLLALYFANLRVFRYHMMPDRWRNTIAFLNVFSVSAVMCSLGSRFVYPQLSLEGHGFWMLGLSPASMKRVVVTKFALALLGMMSTSVVLMLLAARMLDAGPLSMAVAVGLACSVSVAVCGLSTGLGATFLDLRRRNPAAIVSGFGGTLNLVLSLCFMLAAIFPFGGVFHLRLTGRLEAGFRAGLAGCTVWMVLITLAAAILPLWIGIRSLEHREY